MKIFFSSPRLEDVWQMHFSLLGVCLVWLYVRHRRKKARARAEAVLETVVVVNIVDAG